MDSLDQMLAQARGRDLTGVFPELDHSPRPRAKRRPPSGPAIHILLAIIALLGLLSVGVVARAYLDDGIMQRKAIETQHQYDVATIMAELMAKAKADLAEQTTNTPTVTPTPTPEYRPNQAERRADRQSRWRNWNAQAAQEMDNLYQYNTQLQLEYYRASRPIYYVGWGW